MSPTAIPATEKKRDWFSWFPGLIVKIWLKAGSLMRGKAFFLLWSLNKELIQKLISEKKNVSLFMADNEMMPCINITQNLFFLFRKSNPALRSKCDLFFNLLELSFFSPTFVCVQCVLRVWGNNLSAGSETDNYSHTQAQGRPREMRHWGTTGLAREQAVET